MTDILSLDSYTFLLNILIEYAPKIIFGFLFLFFGLRIIRKALNILDNFLKSKSIDESLRPFFKSLLSITLQVALIISVLSMIGVEMTSFLAILGAAGLAIGLALKDTLQNFAAGVMILFFKPFKVGDFIEYEGTKGTVKEIQIFNSVLTTVDNKRVIIPNGILQTSIVINYSSEDIRRIIWTFSIAYGDDFNKAKSILLEWINEDDRILKDKEPMVVISVLFFKKPSKTYPTTGSFDSLYSIDERLLNMMDSIPSVQIVLLFFSRKVEEVFCPCPKETIGVKNRRKKNFFISLASFYKLFQINLQQLMLLLFALLN